MSEYYPLSVLLEKLNLPKSLAAIVGTKLAVIRRSKVLSATDYKSHKSRTVYRATEVVCRSIWTIVESYDSSLLPPKTPSLFGFDVAVHVPPPLVFDPVEDLTLGVEAEVWDEAIAVDCDVVDTQVGNATPPHAAPPEEPETESEMPPDESIPEFDMEMAMQLFEASPSNPFCVEFDPYAWQWLGYSRKSVAKDVLTGRFKKGRDYITSDERENAVLQNKMQNSKPLGGRPSEQFFLTLECFKAMGMTALTEKGDRIREYFLECEQIAKGKASALDDDPLTAQIKLLLQVRESQVENERRLKANEVQTRAIAAKLEEWGRIQAEAHKDLMDLPTPAHEVPPESVDMKTRRIINNYVAIKGVETGDCWRNLYQQYYYRYGRNIATIAKESKLQAFVRLGLIESLYELAIELFVKPLRRDRNPNNFEVGD
jgi:phage anti-repressor protein